MIDVPGELLPALEAMRLAPSAHNTQPWQLRITSSDTLQIAPDLERWLRVADPRGEHLAYSLGCAVESAHCVAELEYEPMAQGDPMAGGISAGVIHWRASIDEAGTCLEQLRQRQTHRGPFAEAPLDTSLLRSLGSGVAGTGLGLSILAERAAIHRVARLTSEGAMSCLGDAGYLRELLRWMRLSKAELDWDGDGFTPETLGLDPWTARLVGWLKRSPAFRRVAVRAGLARAMGMKAGHSLRHSGALLLLTHSESSFPGWVSAGRGLMRLWLAASRAGVSVQPVHFPLVLDDLRRETFGIFGAPASSPAVTLLRIGIAKRAAPASDRLPLDRICTVQRPKEHP